MSTLSQKIDLQSTVSPRVVDFLRELSEAQPATLQFEVTHNSNQLLQLETRYLARLKTREGLIEFETRDSVLVISSGGGMPGVFAATLNDCDCTALRVNGIPVPGLTSLDRDSVVRAVSQKVKEYEAAASERIRNVMIDVASSPPGATGFSTFANSWRVEGREVAPRPRFVSNLLGVELSLGLSSTFPLVWLPVARLDASLSYGGIHVTDSTSGPRLRAVYEAIRRAHKETAPFVGQRFVQKS